eukprot:TRINITY_DN896_c0_g1_i1.p1 TRINITY_DN896_c0_g1~~TRINITY_DN896_c0_g1_i1.p1  ORF type:complete len:148 (+),score=13.57 TRINITY_DN896_c0_g1_i1:167-610(+)
MTNMATTGRTLKKPVKPRRNSTDLTNMKQPDTRPATVASPRHRRSTTGWEGQLRLDEEAQRPVERFERKEITVWGSTEAKSKSGNSPTSRDPPRPFVLRGSPPLPPQAPTQPMDRSLQLGRAASSAANHVNVRSSTRVGPTVSMSVG